MIKHKYILLVLTVLIMTVLACRLPGVPTPPEATITEQSAHQIVPVSPDENASPNPPQSPTLATESIMPTDTLPPPTETVAAPPAPATPTETAPAPTQPPMSQPFLPSGFITAASDYNSITIYNAQGQALAVINTPGMSNAGPDNVHAGDSVVDAVNDVPVIYISMDNQGSIMVNINGEVSELVEGPNSTYLEGVPGGSIFTFSDIWVDNELLISQLYFADPEKMELILVHERLDDGFRAVYPMAIETAGDVPSGVLFTYTLWGIGGDIVFPPREGLYLVDVASLDETLLLTEDFNPIGVSADQRWVAYVPSHGYEEGTTPELTLYDLVTTLMVTVPLASESDRGAGYAAFSPDNAYAAWMEGSGWLMAETPNFTSRVRIADMDGNVLADLPVGTLSNITGISNATWAIPVGWLDSETLIVEIRGDDWNNPALVRVRYDGSGLALLAPGIFAGLVYP